MTNYIPIMEMLHPQFKEIIYCAPVGAKPPVEYEQRFVFFERINFKRHECDACLSQSCIKLVEKNYGNSYGYLQVGDDTLILHKSKTFFMQFDKIWIKQVYQKFNLDTRCNNEWGLPQTTNCKSSFWDAWHDDRQINSLKALLNNMTLSNDDLYNNCASILEKQLGIKNMVYYGINTVDFFYIPREKVRNYIKLMDIFSYYKIISETALPNVVTCLDPTGNNTFNAKGINHLSEKDHRVTKNYVDQSAEKHIKTAIQTDLTHLHPIKFFGMLKMQHSRNTDDNIELKRKSFIFCNFMMSYLYS